MSAEFARQVIQLLAKMPGLLLSAAGSDFPEADINAGLAKMGEFLKVSRAYAMGGFNFQSERQPRAV